MLNYVTRIHFLQGITAQVTINFIEEDLYPPIFSELYYTGVIEDPLVRMIFLKLEFPLPTLSFSFKDINAPLVTVEAEDGDGSQKGPVLYSLDGTVDCETLELDQFNGRN